MVQLSRNWVAISKQLPGRTGKQIRERYLNKLDPSLKANPWTEEEDQKILQLYKEIGPKWSTIALEIKGRSVLLFHMIIRKTWLKIASIRTLNESYSTKFTPTKLCTSKLPMIIRQTLRRLKFLVKTTQYRFICILISSPQVQGHTRTKTVITSTMNQTIFSRKKATFIMMSQTNLFIER